MEYSSSFPPFTNKVHQLSAHRVSRARAVVVWLECRACVRIANVARTARVLPARPPLGCLQYVSVSLPHRLWPARPLFQAWLKVLKVLYARLSANESVCLPLPSCPPVTRGRGSPAVWSAAAGSNGGAHHGVTAVYQGIPLDK